MKLSCKTNKGLTIIEVVIIIFCAVFLYFLFIVDIVKNPTVRGGGINCVNNLKQIWLGFSLWAHDNGEKFPWEVDPDAGGARGKPLWYQYLVATNEIGSPKRLVCPQDKERCVKDLNKFLAEPMKHISYFFSPDATLKCPSLIMVGDRNLKGRPEVIVAKYINLPNTNMWLAWDETMHRYAGNIAFVDGHIERLNNSTLPLAFEYVFARCNAKRIIRIEYP